MGYRLFIDPTTTPQTVYPGIEGYWQQAANHDQAVMAVVLNGLPDEVCASKAWSESDDGQQFARWLVSADLDGTIRLNEHFIWRCHDAGGTVVGEGNQALTEYLNSKFFKCRLNVLPR
ncbi:hypothetical protein [Jeongeupia naejangsanensis]|uniref:Uncharacterized protein n=1 Tax=Jeongeupia naejangsanensis TaxID=613195 RepID=A0ABS2BJ58_9NEIS|nr:hypothetical protein [Jeongeupia naejangsanensis]MBM3115650.1 hypothetical protein [Jeongeupia naejangsanensis]